MPLTRVEIRSAKNRLSIWQKPADFYATWGSFVERLTDVEMFKKSGLMFLRDGWCAAEMAKARDDVVAIRLVPEPAERPDFELRLMNGDIQAYECVEADIDGRKRGDEVEALAEAGNPLIHVPIEEWATAEQARDRLQWAAKKKAAKAKKLAEKGTPYPHGTGLIINLNLQDYGANTADIIAVFAEAVTVARSWFPEIWVLWKSRAHRV